MQSLFFWNCPYIIQGCMGCQKSLKALFKTWWFCINKPGSIKINLPFHFTYISFFSSILWQRLHTQNNQFAITSLSLLVQQFITQQITGKSKFVSGSRMPGIAICVNWTFTIRQSSVPYCFLWPGKKNQTEIVLKLKKIEKFLRNIYEKKQVEPKILYII